ncbi:hypothetical protein Pta02_16460 [Planobispora takensis]|uniref:Chitinase n=1 Tax=Planobispora takensis TaxID=1367882 RepID=A0A8J3SSU9_9ACTN|nr:hypothetical protein Pta02_16460 [Planobispora takensis]
MPVATDRSAARHARGPGTLPRSVTAFASVTLAAATGAAVWLLPTETGQWAAPARAARPEVSVSSPVPPPVAEHVQAVDLPDGGGPSGFVTFVDVVRHPSFDLPRAARRGDVRWFALGHLTAGPDGCTPRWGGRQEQGDNPAAAGLGRLRAAGGDAGLVFGGPFGRELAAVCVAPGALAAAYRQAVGAFDAVHIDFEVQDSADHETVRRRAEALATLQREAQARGRPLAVSFSLPATETGLSPRDQMMLRTTREAGVRIAAVNLLVPIRPVPAGGSRLRPAASAVRAAQPQIAAGLGEPTASERVALTFVLADPGDLSTADARKVADFAARNGLAWLSARGASPDPEAVRLLGVPPL